MDSFSKTTLTRSSTLWNCTRFLSFPVFRGRDEGGDNCGCLPQKIVSMWFLVISLLVLLPCSYGGTFPVVASAPAHYSNEWSPKQDRISNNNYNALNYRSSSGSVVSIPTYRQRQQQFNDYERESTRPEPKPRHGFSLPSLSSLLPTSILNLPQQTSDSENQIETDDVNNGNNSPYLEDSEFQQKPFENQEGNDNPGFHPEGQFPQGQQNFEEHNGPLDSDSSAAPDSGLLSRIRNVLPFGNGFLSGLVNNPDSNADGGENGEGSINNSNNIEPNMNSGNPNDSSPPDPNQVSITNEGDLDSQNSESEDNPQTVPNPLRAMLNLLNLRPPALSDIKQSLDLLDLGSNNPLAQLGGGDDGDSPITALQSLAEGGVGGVFGTAAALLSTVATTIGLTSTNATWFILLGLALGPVIGTAIAASVIAIVYASVYIPAAAIRNEDLDGEFYLLTLKRLFEILGIPDPIEELFGRRSYEGRALLRDTSSSKMVFLANTLDESDECLERAFCQVIGRKLMGREDQQKSWIGRGIKWLIEKFKNNNNNTLRSYKSSSKIFQIGAPLLEAISTGMSSSSSKNNTTNGDHNTTSNQLIVNDNSPQNQHPSCMKYVCNPIKSLQAFFKKQKLAANLLKSTTKKTVIKL